MNVRTLTAVAMLVAGCSGATVINTDESTPAAPATTPRSSVPPRDNAHLVNAFDYVAHPPSGTSYYFSSPSGTWMCAIIPRTKVGCQSSDWPSTMGVAGEPDSVPARSGEPTAPNALIVAREGAPQFVAVERSEFALESGTAKVLPFNRILAAAGFRCNVQEAAGISCLSEFSNRGFTFSADGFVPQYTDVPDSAP